MQAETERMQREAEEDRNKAIRQMLNATDEQWQRIKPQLDRIQQLDAQARVSAGPGSSGGPARATRRAARSRPGRRRKLGSRRRRLGEWRRKLGGRRRKWRHGLVWPSKTPGQSLTSGSRDAQVLCNQLLRDLQTPGAPPDDIAQRVAALRKIRTQAQADLALARKDLRALVTPQQEPALIVMGYLD